MDDIVRKWGFLITRHELIARSRGPLILYFAWKLGNWIITAFYSLKGCSFPKGPLKPILFLAIWNTLHTLNIKLFISEIINSPQKLWSWRQQLLKYKCLDCKLSQSIPNHSTSSWSILKESNNTHIYLLLQVNSVSDVLSPVVRVSWVLENAIRRDVHQKLW